MKTEELKNLTPEMVEELRSLGVEFEDTQMVWVKFVKEVLPVFGSKFKNEWKITSRHSIGDIYETIPAPNCEELMDVLPEMHFVKGNPAWLRFYKLAEVWYIGYVCADKITAKTFKHNSLLKASFELSKWVFGERKALYNLSKAIKGGSDE